MKKINKIGIWIPILGLLFMWRNAITDRADKEINIHQYTMAGLLQIPYTVMVMLIILSKYMK